MAIRAPRDISRPYRAVSCSVFNLGSNQLSNPIPYWVLQGLGSPVLQSLFGNRMFFHLKEVAEKNTFASRADISHFVSGIEFGHGVDSTGMPSFSCHHFHLLM